MMSKRVVYIIYHKIDHGGKMFWSALRKTTVRAFLLLWTLVLVLVVLHYEILTKNSPAITDVFNSLPKTPGNEYIRIPIERILSVYSETKLADKLNLAINEKAKWERAWAEFA